MEPSGKHRAIVRRGMGAYCAVAVVCAWASPHMVLGQASSINSTASGTKTKTANSATASPKKQATAAAKGTGASASPSKSAAKPHSASHPPPDKHPKASTAAAAHNSKSKYASSRKNGKRKTARGQQKIDPERAQAIQEALIREHYMSGEAAGTWNQASEDAMRRYQADHGWQSKTIPDSRALISLGLGPSHDHLLNPESAMTTEPAAPHAESLTPSSHSADPGARMNRAPVSPAPAAPPATPAAKDSSGPQ